MLQKQATTLHNSLINTKPDDEEVNPLEWRKTMTAIGSLFVATLAQHR